MSVTPFRSRRTTSLAFMSRQSWAARCTRCAPSRAEIDGRDVAMRFSEGLFAAHSAATLLCSLATGNKFREGLRLAFRTPRVQKKMPGHATAQPGPPQIHRLLLDDPDLDLGVHVSVESDLDPVNSKRANRLVELDLALLDRESLGFKLVRYVRGGDGAEELALVPDARREGERDLLEFGRQLLRRAPTLLLGLLEALPLLLDSLAVAGRRLVGEPAGKEIVARITRGNLHDVARVP